MPPFLLNILSNLIILLCNSHQPHIHIHNHHSLLIPHITDNTDNRQHNPRQPEILIPRPASNICKDNPAGILKSPRCKCRLEKERFRRTIVFQCLGGRVIPTPCTHISTLPTRSKPGCNEDIQNVGIIIISAPFEINSRNASGNATSQQTNNPTFPTGVSITSCGSSPEEVKYSLSGCQMFFFR